MADVKELTVGGTTYKIKDEVCRTNILYVLGKTGYNLLEVTATSGTVSGVAYTVNKNAITISSNGSNTTSTFVLNSGSPLFKASNNIFAIDKVMPAGATITVKYTDGTIVGFNANNQNTNTTLNNAKDVESIYLYIDANKTINDTIKVMVCTQDDWEVTHEITPYQGIQNYDLTRLQSEDRAGLVECVDGGAKNQLNVALDTIKGLNTGGTWTNNRYVNYGVTFTVNSDGTVTATGTAEAQHNASLILAKYSTSTAIEGMVLSGVPNANGARIAIQRNSSPWSTVVYIDSGTSDKIIPSFNYESILFCMVSGGSTVTNAVFKPMICTKAAFGVSQKFVPYQTIPKVILNSRTAFTSSTTMTYTGVSYTIPAHTAVRITANLLNSHGNPVEAAIASYANQNIYLAYNEMPTDRTIGVNTVSFMYATTDSGYTVAVLAKFSNATENYVHLVVEKLS